MATTAPLIAKPVKLQINTAGAWRNVIEFDAAEVEDAGAVMFHASVIARVGSATLRIVTADGMQTALCSWTADEGWRDFATGKALT
jgi:hypothetical protein